MGESAVSNRSAQDGFSLQVLSLHVWLSIDVFLLSNIILVVAVTSFR